MKLGPCMAWWGSALMAVAAVMAAPRGERGSTGLENVLLQSRSSQSGLTRTGAAELSVDKLSSRVQALLATFGDSDTVPENIQESLALIRELVEELRGKLQEPITSESSALHALAEGFQACVDVATSTWPAMQEGDPALQAEMADARNRTDAHHACRAAEVQHRIEVVDQAGACRTFQSAVEETHSVKPNLTFASMDDFFTNEFDVAAFTQKAEACETGVETYQSQIASCKEQQKAFEVATCHWHSMAVQADITCKSLQLCRDEEGSTLSDACAKAEERVERWSAEVVAIDHIECLLGELGTGSIKAAAVQACTQESNTTNSKNLTCPNVTFPIDEQQCKSLVKPADIETVPGAAPWVDTQYRGKPWFSDATNDPRAGDEISSLVACELPHLGNTPSTTPAPEAPTLAMTTAATLAPTVAPTPKPTQAPTSAPTPAPTLAPTVAPTPEPTQAATSEDTPGWNNNHGYPCATYVSAGWCCGKGFCPGKEWTGAPGPDPRTGKAYAGCGSHITPSKTDCAMVYNYPALNCVACGKAPTSAPTPAPTLAQTQLASKNIKLPQSLQEIVGTTIKKATELDNAPKTKRQKRVA